MPERGRRPHVVIIGGGFGGLTCARALGRSPVLVTLVDRANHHLFQPLLYQVASAGLSPGDIAMPIRAVLRTTANATVLLAEVRTIDVQGRKVVLTDGDILDYDYLVVAAGARTSYFGHSTWPTRALGLKDIEDALAIRDRVLRAFERAERANDETERAKLLTFVVIGGGPTGVEIAGAFGELARFVLARDFRRVRPADARIVLLEGGPRILPSFDPVLSESAVRQLGELGVQVQTSRRVLDVDDDGVTLGDGRIDASTVVWAAGVTASPLGAQLGVELDRGGRVHVAPDLSLPGRSEVFVVGDMARALGKNGEPLPGIAPVAMQQARHVASTIDRECLDLTRVPFVYNDKGVMATIGRSRAIVQVGGVRAAGFFAWCMWLVVHLVFLIGFRNRVLVLFEWFWSYVTYKRGARLITGAKPHDPR